MEFLVHIVKEIEKNIISVLVVKILVHFFTAFHFTKKNAVCNVVVCIYFSTILCKI